MLALLLGPQKPPVLILVPRKHRHNWGVNKCTDTIDIQLCIEAQGRSHFSYIISVFNFSQFSNKMLTPPAFHRDVDNPDMLCQRFHWACWHFCWVHSAFAGPSIPTKTLLMVNVAFKKSSDYPNGLAWYFSPWRLGFNLSCICSYTHTYL